MKNMIRWAVVVALAVCPTLLPCASAQSAGLGRISFPTSGPADAQSHFLRGVLFLHSFEYREAREEFAQARKIAPDFAMAYWGEAMTYNEPLWFAQDRDGALAALKRLGATPAQRLAKAPTEREKSYVRAVETLFGAGAKEARDLAYSTAMRDLHRAYPEDDEAAAFYALSLVGTCHRGRDFRVYMQAAAVVEEVFARNQQHPGALHYLIHCYDDPIHAPLGLRAARIYANVAPEAAHALHMPSHIFFASGMWDEAVKSNEDAWAASVQKAKRRGAPIEAGGYHSLWWLSYAYLQQGRYQEARRTLRLMEQVASPDALPLVRFHLVQMRAAFAIDTGEPYIASTRTSDLDLPAVGADLLAAGLSALNHGRRADADAALAGLRGMRERAGAPVASDAHAGYGHSYPGDAQAVEIMESELAALLMMTDGNAKEAIGLMKKAVELEDRMAFEFGPPVPPKPAHELFGEILLQLGQPQLARVQFELALLRTPRRALSLMGLARAYSQSGDRAAAQRTYGEIERMWHKADTELRKALQSGRPQ